MKIAFFSTQPYDKEYFTRHNSGHQLVFFEAQLNEQTVQLADGCVAICAFVNDSLNAATIKQLAAQGVQLIAMRSAGYNNVDLPSAQLHNIKVVHVPA